jgi:hypothetical protein
MQSQEVQTIAKNSLYRDIIKKILR